MTNDGFEPNSSSSWCSAKAAATSPKKNALRHVAGYSVGIDFTARDLFFRKERLFQFDFMLGKAQDTMSPVGPTIVPRLFLDGTRANFALSVNGVKKQSGNTADMIYSLPGQIAGVSRAVTIEPGARSSSREIPSASKRT
jgi:2-keto-4-pentenoate hydratase/2-oxohepta-3-ene-1,7-dioic acid hydratase in catechol pathway